MARTTVKELEARINEMNEQQSKLAESMDRMLQMMMASTQVGQAKPAKEPKPWLQDCPDYATPAQRTEYDKLAKRAASQRKAVMEALGTETVTAFIPVPKTADRMPHTVKWSAIYSK